MFKLNLDKAYEDYQNYLNSTSYCDRFGNCTKYTFSQFIKNDIQTYIVIETTQTNIESEQTTDYSQDSSYSDDCCFMR